MTEAEMRERKVRNALIAAIGGAYWQSRSGLSIQPSEDQLRYALSATDASKIVDAILAGVRAMKWLDPEAAGRLRAVAKAARNARLVGPDTYTSAALTHALTVLLDADVWGADLGREPT